jgi:signal transduction histidine kinase
MRYFQQINRDQQEQQGMGMGLPLARQVVEVHGGVFLINSLVGRGTKISISLPLLN